jgi:phosphohistidine phosphatase
MLKAIIWQQQGLDMTKRLYFLRHSKAGQTNKNLVDDHDRELTDKGELICPYIGRFIKSSWDLPQFVLTSTAARARKTAELVVEAIGESIPIFEERRLYLASPGEIMDIIRSIDSKYESVLIVGHNPGLQMFCIQFAGTGNKQRFREMRANFSPASLAAFNMSGDWSNVSTQAGELLDFTSAKKIAKVDVEAE